MTNTNFAEDAVFMREEFFSQIDVRKEYEQNKSENASSICKKLDDLYKNATETHIAIFLACNVDFSFINRQERANARFNIYAAQKVVKLCSAMTLDAFTRAIVATLHRLHENNLQATRKDVESACSADIKTESAREKLIKDVKRKEHIAANTVSTQASSSLNALDVMNMLVTSRNSENKETFSLNYDNEHVTTILRQLDMLKS